MTFSPLESRERPLMYHVLNILFGSGIALFIFLSIYSFENVYQGIYFHSFYISTGYSLIALWLSLALAKDSRSTYGTRMLNAYCALSLRALIVIGALMVAVVIVFQNTNLYPTNMFGRYVLEFLIFMANLICLGLIRGISLSIKRMVSHPTFEGCTFLFVGDVKKSRLYWDSIPDREKNGLRGVYYDPAQDSALAGEELQQIIEKSFVEKAVFLNPSADAALMDRCAVQGIEVWKRKEQDSEDIELTARTFDIQANAPKPPLSKFAFDRLVSLFLIVFSSPFWLIAIVGIWMADRGPIFYQQARSGLYGKHFGMWKFRTMYTDADKRLDEVKAKYGNEMDGPIFKLENDPRIFKFGKFLRKFSIDELPQFINILMGDMSLVGPRPLPVYETEAFENIEHRRRLSVPPGLTCYWQIEGRSDVTSFDEFIKLDYKYIENFGFWLDVGLLAKTLPAVLLAKGAK